MEFQNLISGSISYWHIGFSVAALLFGSIILALKKGTALHKKIGYAYLVSMVGVNATAFAIYRLFGSFGIFHYMAVISSLTLLAGMLPIWLKKPRHYIQLHLSFMYWSVMGLYGAFVAETLVRIPSVVIESGIPNSTFYSLSGIGTGVVMFIAAFFFIRNKSKWFNF